MRTKRIDVPVDTVVSVDLDDVLPEIETEDLRKELQRRTNTRPFMPVTDAVRDWERLAELIAEGDARSALDLLASLSPVPFSPHITRNLVARRFGRAA